MSTSKQFIDIKASMRHQWRPCLEALGIPLEALDGKSHPCPACGGTDRFTFDDPDGNGSYYCRGCNPGDGFSLLQKYHHWTAKEALQAVANWLGISTGNNVIPFTRKHPIAAVAVPKTDPERIKGRIRQLWTEATPLSADKKAMVAHSYFHNRGLVGLSGMPANVRLHQGLAYWWRDHNDKPIKLGTYPALLSLVRTVDRKVTGLHRTYLKPDGSGKLAITSPDDEPLPAKKLLSVSDRSTYGCAVQTYPIDGSGGLAIAEGLETSLAVTLLWDIPCWPCLSAGGIERFQVPASVRELVICCDNDASGVGQSSGKSLARRLLALPSAPVIKLMVPDDTGTDWLDYLNATRRGVRHG